MSHSVVAGTIRGFAKALSHTLISEQSAHRRGLLQLVDPRVKLLCLMLLVVAAALSHRLEVLAALFVTAVLLAIASRVSLAALARRVWLVIFAFSALIAAPALFITPGRALWTIPGTSLAVTEQGLRSAALLVTRVETAVTLSTLLVLTTPWFHLLKAMRSFGIPSEIVAMLAMVHRYVVLLVETAISMFESRQSRMVGTLSRSEQRQLAIRTGGVLLSKTMALGDEVYLAMVSRGFRGDIFLLSDFRMRGLDVAFLVAFLFAGAVAIIVGR